MPPELLRDGIIGKFTDIYSFGILLWEMSTSDIPFMNTDYDDIIVQVMQNKRPVIPDDMPASLKSLLEACWKHSYKERPSINEICDQLDCKFLFIF